MLAAPIFGERGSSAKRGRQRVYSAVDCVYVVVYFINKIICIIKKWCASSYSEDSMPAVFADSSVAYFSTIGCMYENA